MDTPLTLIVYSVIDSQLIDPEREQSEIFVWNGDRPNLGHTLSLGTEREWQVCFVETYQGGGHVVHLALVAAIGVVPERSTWIPIQDRLEYPDISLYLNLTEETVLSHGSRMDGAVLLAPLYSYQFINGTIESVYTGFTPRKATLCLPSDPQSAFASIQLRWCERIPLPEAIAL